jgi:hypothetical protein
MKNTYFGYMEEEEDMRSILTFFKSVKLLRDPEDGIIMVVKE